MWSKTKKALDDRLADSLKKRVRYTCEVYTTNKLRWWTETPVFYIYVDGKMWFATNPNGVNDEGSAQWELMCQCPEKMSFREKLCATEFDAKRLGFKKHGWMTMEELTKHLHRFLHELSIEEALSGEDYMYLILAIMDRRVGKRRIKALLDNVEEYPEWMRKWIRLRAEAENIK